MRGHDSVLYTVGRSVGNVQYDEETARVQPNDCKPCMYNNNLGKIDLPSNKCYYIMILIHKSSLALV